MKALCLISVLGMSLSSFAAKRTYSNPFIDFSKLQLNDYREKLAADESIKAFTSEGAKSADSWVITTNTKDGKKILSKQLFDLNMDSNVDYVKTFSKSTLVKVEADTDYDNKADFVQFFDEESGKLEMKVIADNSTNIWLHYYKNELRRKDYDRDQNRKPDMWQYFRNGKMLKTEVAKGSGTSVKEDITDSITDEVMSTTKTKIKK